MILFITGPTTEDVDNKTMFQNIKSTARKHGHHTVDAYDLIKNFNTDDFESDEFLKEILINILSADMVFTLADWHTNKASNIIVDLARKVNIEVKHITQFKTFLSCQQ